MPTPDLIALALLACVVAAFVAAAVCDIATMLIPNRISVGVAVMFAPAALLAGLTWPEIGWHVAMGVTVFAVGFFLFNLGVLGGGDVKLFAAAAIWTGPAALLSFLTVTFLAGGVLAATMLGVRRVVQPSPDHPAFINRLTDRSRGIPYAIAIAAGACVTAWQWPIAKAAFG